MTIRQLSNLAIALLLTITAVKSKANTAALTAAMLTYSAVATETNFQFDGRVGMRSASVPSKDAAQKQIRKQMKFIQSSFRRLEIASVRSWTAAVTKIENVSPGAYRIHYRFTGTVLMSNSVSNSVEVLLPINPDTVETAERIQFCEDPHLGSGAFYYYWNPREQNCPMVLNSDYLSFTGVFGRYPNTVQTYPEYGRLFQNGELRMVLMLGKVSPNYSANPVEGNPWSYPTIQHTLRTLGFASRLISTLPFMEEYTLRTPRGLVSVTVFYGDTGIADANNRIFHNLYKSALENSSVIMYGGHAGSGKNLDLSLIKANTGVSIQPPRDRYQIMLLSACFPYAYYVQDYFKVKATAQDPRGYKNLDIMAEGVEGGFDRSGVQMANTVKAIVDYATGSKVTSYQELLNSHPHFSKAIMAVTGDEDNPTSPSFQ